MVNNLLLDCSHIYLEESLPEENGLIRVDLSDLPGTDMYCSEEASEEIRIRLERYSPRGIHFIDNGNYHYMTLFFTEKIREPFSLVLFDHHTDMQKPMMEGMLSCGSWAGELLKKKLLSETADSDRPGTEKSGRDCSGSADKTCMYQYGGD